MKRGETFQKWDAHDQEQTGPKRFPIESSEPRSPRIWMLKVAWLVSTSMLVLGAFLVILILAGEGHRIGL